MNYHTKTTQCPFRFFLVHQCHPCHPVSLEIFPSLGTPRSEIIHVYAHDILFSLPLAFLRKPLRIFPISTAVWDSENARDLVVSRR